MWAIICYNRKTKGALIPLFSNPPSVVDMLRFFLFSFYALFLFGIVPWAMGTAKCVCVCMCNVSIYWAFEPALIPVSLNGSHSCVCVFVFALCVFGAMTVMQTIHVSVRERDSTECLRWPKAVGLANISMAEWQKRRLKMKVPRICAQVKQRSERIDLSDAHTRQK